MGQLRNHIHHEHELLKPHIDSLRIAADAVGEVPVEILRELTDNALGFLMRELVPHAQREESILYRAVEHALHAPAATRTMHREHVEISKYTEELSTLHGSVVASHELSGTTARELKRVLYGLYALASLHFVKEDEIYAALLESKLPEDEQQQLLMSLEGH